MNSNLLKYFVTKEEQMIAREIHTNFLSKPNQFTSISQKEIHLINANLLLTDESNIAFKVHGQLINSLITAYISARFQNNLKELATVFRYEQIVLITELVEKDIEDIPELVEELHITFLNSEFAIKHGIITRTKSKHHLRESGAVYTLKHITNQIVTNTIANAILNKTDADAITCLDFASGTGRFYFEAVDILHKTYGLPLQAIICNNLFAVDLDETALTVLRCKVIASFPKLNSKIIKALSTNIINRNALIPKLTLIEENIKGIDLSNDFKTVFANKGFDVVFSNPPYCLLKVNQKENDQRLSGYYANLTTKIQSQISFFRTSGFYQYSIEGMLNYYQLSIEMILRLTKASGQIGIICPSSLFADLTSAKLRKHLLTSNELYFIKYYPEAARLFENVSQSTVIFYLRKGNQTDRIKIEKLDKIFQIKLATIMDIFPNNFEIPLIDKIGWRILGKISKQKKIREISYIRNRRGELDLTFFKPFITTENTGWRLVRGNMISNKCLMDRNGEFVQIDNFLNKKSSDFKLHDYNKVRLVCQQISNIDVRKRLRFVFCKKTDILANSCNYMVSTRNQSDLSILSHILNSSLLNWRFKITSSNNHINNYELDELPMVDLDRFDVNEFANDEKQSDELVCQMYGLNKSETKYIWNANKYVDKSLV